MKRLLIALFTILSTIQSANAMNIDAFLDKHVAPVSNRVSDIIFFPVNIAGTSIPIVILWILFGGLFFAFFIYIQLPMLRDNRQVLGTPALVARIVLLWLRLTQDMPEQPGHAALACREVAVVPPHRPAQAFRELASHRGFLGDI